MATDLRTDILTKEEYLQGASLSYSPVILALTKKQAHDVKLDQVKFKSIDVEKDSIVAFPLTKEATEKMHIKAGDSSKVFNIYVKGAKYIQSLRSGVSALPKLHNRVLLEYSKIFDKDSMSGDGHNNGLLVSADENYTTNGNHQIPAVGGDVTEFTRVQNLIALVGTLQAQVDASHMSQNITIFYYGDDLVKMMGSVTQANETPVGELLQKAWAGVRWIKIPSAVLPEGAGQGLLVVADDLVTLHYCQEPTIENDGTNEEDNYYFANYITGSTMVDVEEKDGIIKQPITFA